MPRASSTPSSLEPAPVTVGVREQTGRLRPTTQRSSEALVAPYLLVKLIKKCLFRLSPPCCTTRVRPALAFRLRRQSSGAKPSPASPRSNLAC